MENIVDKMQRKLHCFWQQGYVCGTQKLKNKSGFHLYFSGIIPLWPTIKKKDSFSLSHPDYRICHFWTCSSCWKINAELLVQWRPESLRLQFIFHFEENKETTLFGKICLNIVITIWSKNVYCWIEFKVVTNMLEMRNLITQLLVFTQCWMRGDFE